MPRWESNSHGEKSFATVGLPPYAKPSLLISLQKGGGRRPTPTRRGRFPTAENGIPPREIIFHLVQESEKRGDRREERESRREKRAARRERREKRKKKEVANREQTKGILGPHNRNQKAKI